MNHPTHKTRYSDSSQYDEVCEYCGTTDGHNGRLEEPCLGHYVKREKVKLKKVDELLKERNLEERIDAAAGSLRPWPREAAVRALKAAFPELFDE